MRETTVEKHLRKRVIAAGGLIRKMIWPGHRGAPDRLVVWSYRQKLDGKGFFHYANDIDLIELKRPGGKLDEHQVREHQKLRDMGCTVITLDSIEAVDAYINERTN